MSNLPSLQELENRLNTGSMPAFILDMQIYKGMVGRQNQYKFVVNSNDHVPPHVHIAVNDQQIAKYNLLTGECIESRYPKLNKIFADWFAYGDNREQAKQEWVRFHGSIGAN